MYEAATAETGRTRRGILRAAVAGGMAAAGGAAVATRGGGGTSFASPSSATDTRILNLFLLLERLQQSFYRSAIESGRLRGELLRYAQAAASQESDHVNFLTRRLGSHAGAPPQTGPQLEAGTQERFRDDAITLEEAALAAYIGQGANLTRGTVAQVAVLVSVEARQAAWIRDIAGISPAPRAADPARPAREVLAELRQKGMLR
jgi:Ferritin-like domain